MKPLFLAAFVVTSIATPLFSGAHDSQNDLIIGPPVDWGGFYIGGAYASVGGTLTYAPGPGPDYNLGGGLGGGFAGYNIQNGNIIYGAEAAYSVGRISDETAPNFRFVDLFDIKARLGVEVGDAMLYGIAGWTNALWDENGIDLDAGGVNAGLGIDYLVSDSFFIGAEYIFRDMDETASNVFLAPLQSVQLRAGLKF